MVRVVDWWWSDQRKGRRRWEDGRTGWRGRARLMYYVGPDNGKMDGSRWRAWAQLSFLSGEAPGSLEETRDEMP